MGLNVSPAVTMDDNMRLEIKCPVKSVNELLNNKRYDFDPGLLFLKVLWLYFAIIFLVSPRLTVSKPLASKRVQTVKV